MQNDKLIDFVDFTDKSACTCEKVLYLLNSIINTLTRCANNGEKLIYERSDMEIVSNIAIDYIYDLRKEAEELSKDYYCTKNVSVRA